MEQPVDFNPVPRGRSFTRLRPEPQAIRSAVELLTHAASPVMIIGSGVAQSGALTETVELAQSIGAPSMIPGWRM